MTPLFFGGRDRRLFGIYSPADTHRATRASPRGVVLCAPWGCDYTPSHRSLVALGRQLQSEGLHVLRFDYHGTGDSGGEVADETPRGWLGDVESAVEELRDVAGVEDLAILGVRAGALVAAEVAAQRAEVTRLLLWDPLSPGDAALTQAEDPQLPAGRDWSAELATLRLDVPRAGLARIVLQSEPGGARTSIETELVPGPAAWLAEGRNGVGALHIALLARATEWLAAP